jgi:integrase
MGLYRRGKIYWYTISYNGRRVQASTGTSNKRLAEKIYAKVFNDLIEGTYFEQERIRQIRFEQMVKRYLAQYEKQRDGHTVKQLMKYFSGMTIGEITTPVVNDYRIMRLEVVKPATVYQELALLRRMFNVAIREWEWLRDNPVSRLSFAVGNRNARDRWLTGEEEQKLLKHATNPWWLRPLLITALHSGMRKGEILNLKWADVDFKRRCITVQKSKNKTKRTIPLSNTLHSTLKEMKIRDISGRVFPISDRSLRAAFGKTLEKSGIEDFRFHDLRHTFATRLVQNGVDLYKVKELLGHKTIAMTMRYAHHCPETLRSSVEVLDACYNSATVAAEAKG